MVIGFDITNLQTDDSPNQYPGSRNTDDLKQGKILTRIKMNEKILI